MKQHNKKLKKAIKLLGEAYKSELPPVYLSEAFKSNKVSEEQIYESLKKNSFEWVQGKWEKPTPSWIKGAIQQFESDLLRALPLLPHAEIDVWSVTPNEIYTQIPIFRDYLTSMETFIKAEIEERERALQEVQDLFPPDEWGPPIEWIPNSDALENVEDFAYILRSSFFANLIAYTEIFLVDRYRINAQGKHRNIPTSSVIKTTASTLVGPLNKKVPGWDYVVNKYTGIRNCLVHNYGFLDDSEKHDEIRKYIRNQPSLRIDQMTNVYVESDDKHEKIILTEEFCQQALTSVERFLLAVDFIANQLGTSGRPGRTDYLQES